MNLAFKRMQKDDFIEYVSWFADAALNQALGPMDVAEWPEWQPEFDPFMIAWVIFREAEMVAVVTTAFDAQGELPVGITGLGIKPALRGQGIGTAVLQQLLDLHKSQGIREHIAYVHLGNGAGRRCLEKAGFAADDESGPNEYGYVKFEQKW